MVRRVMVIILSVIGFVSCDSKVEIVYNYKDIVIKRVDKNGKTIFYYDEISKDSPRIWVEYSGINDGFSCYLKFDESGKVSILSGDGYFQTINDDTTKFEYRRIAAYQRPELTENVYFVQNAIRYEQEKNNGSVTKVNVAYPIKY
ncbi:hypothetical protein A3SI_04057 [Nitritalea halalkaliphila LW7]|uniref:Lipoprotein n=1 Tax=Nitritalea halalkaliphila LW7 TaxID=1189621 RepID=I5C8Z4_9BACT|nr:hypothetical protein [Nitritalea halalkaliphila]EIM78296.1 hypothetical protein A3SI_04057 [Nitritalea halalkaliphila LW7]